MSSLRRSIVFTLQAAVAGLALAFVLTQVFPERFGRPTPPPPAPAVTATAPASYAEAVQRAAPSVVNIYTQRLVTEQPYRLFGDPVYQRYSGLTLVPPRRRLERSLGSGVIVRADGYVLTNNHVIADAKDILVGLWDGRVTPASVVGTDRDTDLAVLRIEGSNFPAAPIGEAGARLAVGDVVLAIGNSLGLGQTVTLGIVSATGRNQLSLSRYEDFIQTDAAINLGNSGGALVDARGELVGINTAVFGQGQGISFAIPAPAAARVLQAIVENGRVIRGWIGAEYAEMPPSAGANGSPRGVQIVALLPGGPADQAGLRPGDVLLTLDGAPIEDESELRAREAGMAPGSRVVLGGRRAGVPFEKAVVLIERGA